jgi:NTP pyrophosphatase (non-canonical NTP hydrolase)
MSRAEKLVAEIVRLDLRHRKGFVPSEASDADILKAMRGEIRELEIELKFRNVGASRDELGDVFACVLQMAKRLGMSFAELDAEAERKLRMRFLGADKIEVL